MKKFAKHRKTSSNEVVKSKIRVLFERDPSHTLLSLKHAICDIGVVISTATIARHLKMDFTRKRLNMVPVERNTTRTLNPRQEYCKRINNTPDTNLVLLDDTCFNMHTRKHYGYSLKNTICYVTRP